MRIPISFEPVLRMYQLLLSIISFFKLHMRSEKSNVKRRGQRPYRDIHISYKLSAMLLYTKSIVTISFEKNN